jgi:hypothetical protein
MASGYRSWTPGEFVTNDVMQGYLQDQVVMNIATSASRPGSPTEGMLVFQRDNNCIYLYDADSSQWRLWITPRIAFTPQFYADTTEVTYGTSATQTGHYVVAGGLCTLMARWVLGTSPSVAACTSLQLGLPFTSAYVSTQVPGSVYMRRNTGTVVAGAVRIQTSSDGTKAAFAYASGTWTSGVASAESNVDETLPWAWAAADEINVKMSYPIW